MEITGIELKALRAYKTELAPNNRQRTYFRRCAGTARFVFNWALADRKLRFERGEKTSLYSQTKRFNSIKDEQCPWVREVPYAVTESAFRNCDAAFQHFFRRVKNKEKEPGYPRFKRRGGRESFQLKSTGVELDRARLTSPIGWVRLKERFYIPMEATRYGTYATISERAGRWFISVLVEEDVESVDLTGEVVGVDLGINSLAVVSNGTVFENPKALRNAERKLARLQRELSRRRRGGANWRKTKAKLAAAHYKVACIRSHTLHQISHYLTFELYPSAIVLEDLNVSGMLKNHHLARAISDVGFYELRRQIEYKAEWNGITVMFANRFYPSSKTCSECGSVREKLTLSERLFICPECGVVLDRDLNAAKNLAALVEPQNLRGLPGELVPLGATVNQEVGSAEC